MTGKETLNITLGLLLMALAAGSLLWFSEVAYLNEATPYGISTMVGWSASKVWQGVGLVMGGLFALAMTYACIWLIDQD